MTRTTSPVNLKPTIIHLRKNLLEDAFFDPDQQAEELAVPTRPSAIEFSDLLVLLARLYRVLVRDIERKRLGLELNENERLEKMHVRNECLNQPFFDRERVVDLSTRLFSDGAEIEDEGCFA